MGMPEALIPCLVGIEAVDDLIADLSQALEFASQQYQKTMAKA